MNTVVQVIVWGAGKGAGMGPCTLWVIGEPSEPICMYSAQSRFTNCHIESDAHLLGRRKYTHRFCMYVKLLVILYFFFCVRLRDFSPDNSSI